MKATTAARCACALLALALLAGCTSFKRFAYEGVGRDEWQKPEEVIRALELKPGDRVADLGAGSGYFTFRLARAVGPDGKVYAVDIDPDMIAYLGERAKAENAANVEIVAARPDDPGLAPGSVDLIFTSDAYHHIDDRVRYFASVAKVLRPGGRIAIVDFNGSGWAVRMSGHYTPIATAKKEMAEAGYRLVKEADFLEKQFFLVFAR
jgi:arsenite methyltransferase